MIQKPSEENVSRRNFLRAAVVTAAAASATGAGAALMRSGSQTLPPLPAVPQPNHETLIATGGDVAAEMFGQLATLQADNIRLQSRLDALHRQLKYEQTDAASADQALAVELGAATERVSILSGLLSLYQQLDEVDLGELLEQGVASVSAGITDLFDVVPGLLAGIEAGQEALDELEQHIPSLQEGQLWLKAQRDKLQGHFTTLEMLLQSAVDVTAPFLMLLNEWFQDILKWLPFGLGERASRILRAIGDLVDETPSTISGLDKNVVQPLDSWIGSAGEVPLHKHLVKPLREELIQTAQQTVTRAEQMRVIYQRQLADPMRTAVDSRRAVHDRIAQYCERHRI